MGAMRLHGLGGTRRQVAHSRDTSPAAPQTWLDDALSAARELRPKVLVVTTLQYIANAWLIPEILRHEEAASAAESQPAAGSASVPLPSVSGDAAPGGGGGSRGGAPTIAVPRLLVAHTVLANSTAAYAPATAGLGVSLPLGFLNRRGAHGPGTGGWWAEEGGAGKC